MRKGRQNSWIEQPKKEDRIPEWNILRIKTHHLDRTSQEERLNAWIEHPKKNDRILNTWIEQPKKED